MQERQRLDASILVKSFAAGDALSQAPISAHPSQNEILWRCVALSLYSWRKLNAYTGLMFVEGTSTKSSSDNQRVEDDEHIELKHMCYAIMWTGRNNL